ncbi:(2Fe-2S)-binding protein [Streptomyces sp. NPDC054796]
MAGTQGRQGTRQGPGAESGTGEYNDRDGASAAAGLLARAARTAPMTAAMTGLQGQPDGVVASVPAEFLGERDWLAEQVRLSALRWRTDSLRVGATLWWYSVSTVLLAPPLVTGFLTGRSVHPGPEGLVLQLGAAGRPVAVRPAPHMSAPVDGAAPGPLRGLLELCVDGLAGVAGLRPRPLWSLATDSLAQLLSRAGRESGRLADSTAWGAALAERIGPPMPPPRWVEVPVPDGGDGLFPVPPPGAPRVETFVRRGSCCLIYESPGEGKCASCPRRTPDDRALQLEIAASRMASYG